MYYAIKDNDVNSLLYTGCNETDKRAVMRDYLYYRKEDLGEWWKLDSLLKENSPNLYETISKLSGNEFNERFNELFDIFVKECPDNYILDDMAACNFELISNNEPFKCL